MDQTSALSSTQDIFQVQSIPFAKIPAQTKLFIDYQNNKTVLDRFYPTKDKSLKSLSETVLENYQTDRNSLCDVLRAENKIYEASDRVFENIERLRDKDCLAVLTGQQAGLFSGPIYTIYKALSAIKLAEELNETGIKAVPIFWIASEDHDFAEISKTYLIDADEKLFMIESSPDSLTQGLPVGKVEIEENISHSINQLLAEIKKTEFSEKVENLLNQTYQDGETYSTAFGKMLAKVFNKYGLIFVSPLNKDLRELSTPIYKKAIEKADQIRDSLIKRDSEIKAEGYHSQVLVEDDFFPFFYLDESDKRISLRFDKNNNQIKSQNGDYVFSTEELLTIASDKPYQLSPNALMRPIVQDYLFPTICYFGGGAEIAYFGQNSAIYETLDRPITQIRHRASFTVIEGKHRRNLGKYNLSYLDLFAGKEKVTSDIIEKYINNETSATFDETYQTILNQLSKLKQELSEIDPTLSANLDNREKKIVWHIDTLRKKFQTAELKRNRVLNRRIDGLWTAIFPNEVLQERNLNFLHFFNLYGENFIEWIYHSVNTKEKGHQLIIF